MTNKKRTRLTLLLTICCILITHSLFAVDVGAALEQNAKYSGSGGDTAFACDGIAIPRITGLIGDTGDFYVSAGFNGMNDPWSFVPELLRTDVNWRSDSMNLTIGRMAYDDPLGYIASGLFDGGRVTFDTDKGSFSAGAWYTGLLYKKRGNIEMTENEYRANNTALDYGDFANSYFAPRRALIAADWEHQGLLEKAVTRLSLLGQFDLTKEKLNSQYLAAKVMVPYGVFGFDFGGCFELVEADDEIETAFAAEAAVEWRRAVHYLSLGAKYASGKSGAQAAFLPLTTNTQGYILEPKLSGITMIALNYTARLNEAFSAGLYPAYFMLNGADSGGKNRLGGEIYAALYWSPAPDIGMKLGGGAFMPSLGNVAPDGKADWRVELNVVLALF